MPDSVTMADKTLDRLPGQVSDLPVKISDRITDSIADKRAGQVPELEKNTSKLDESKDIAAISRSLDVPSTVQADEQTKNEKPALTKFEKFFHHHLPALSTALASLLHAVTGTGRMIKILPDTLQGFLEKHTLSFSKFVNVSNFSVKSWAAFKKDEGFLGLSRLLYPLVVPFLKLEDVFLGAGLSSGLTMMYFGQEKFVKKTNDNLENIFLHLKQFKKTFHEILTKGAGPNGVIFKKFGGEEPHTMFLSGIFNFGGAALGLLSKYVLKLPGDFGKFVQRLAAVIRNLPGGALSDYAKMFSKNKNLQIAAGGYLGTSGLDLTKNFLEEEKAVTASHFVQALCNVANFYYTKGDEKT